MTNLAMTEERFWKIIADSNGNHKKVTGILTSLTNEEILSFSIIFDNKYGALAIEANKDFRFCSDGFDYSIAYHVGCGQKHYEDLLNSLKGGEKYDYDGYNDSNELLMYAANYAWEEKHPTEDGDDYYEAVDRYKEQLSI